MELPANLFHYCITLQSTVLLKNKFKSIASFLGPGGNLKPLIVGIITVTLFLSSSYAAVSYERDYTLKTFIVEGNKENMEIGHYDIQTFVAGEEPSGRDISIGIRKGSECVRERNRIYRQMEEEIERCIEKITKNWKRTYHRLSYEKVYDKKGEIVEESTFLEKEREFYGYDKDEDFRLRLRLGNRALNAENIC